MKYTEILDWDRRIREFIPPNSDVRITVLEKSPDSETPAESLLLAVYKETSACQLFYLRMRIHP